MNHCQEKSARALKFHAILSRVSADFQCVTNHVFADLGSLIRNVCNFVSGIARVVRPSNRGSRRHPPTPASSLRNFFIFFYTTILRTGTVSELPTISPESSQCEIGSDNPCGC